MLYILLKNDGKYAYVIWVIIHVCIIDDCAK